MNEYIVHYIDKDDKRVHVFYFLDYKNLDMLMKDLIGLDFEHEYGEVVDIERVVIDELEEQQAASA